MTNDRLIKAKMQTATAIDNYIAAKKHLHEARTEVHPNDRTIFEASQSFRRLQQAMYDAIEEQANITINEGEPE